MADAPVVHIGENSPEEVAYKLMEIIARSEGKNTSAWNSPIEKKWLLDTYAECLQATKGLR